MRAWKRSPSSIARLPRSGENRPLAQAHLLRAIQLEYRELGKLSTSSRME
jgi:hypothetical protein